MKKNIILNFMVIVFFAMICSGCNNVNINQIKVGKKAAKAIAEKTVKPIAEKTAKPIVEKKPITIVIDPGHGGKSNLEKEPISPGSTILKIKDGGGAQGIFTRTPEYVINSKVALKLKYILQKRGYLVVMTKTEASEDPGNVDRAKVGNKANADLVVRIHADSSDNNSAMGASMLIPAPINDETKKIYNESKRCGNIIINKVTSEVGMKNRGIVQRDDMTGFNWSKVPVVLIEMGFLSNTAEDKLLSSNDYESKIAVSLADGIDGCFK